MRRHPSEQSDAFHAAVLEAHTPANPLTCQLCSYPGSIASICSVCNAMIQILAKRPSSYWLALEAEERIKERLRKQEEGPLGFTI